MHRIVEDNHRVSAGKPVLRIDVGAGNPLHPLFIEGRSHVR